jgi:hypothetical protein
MANQHSDARALRPADKLADAHNWKHLARRHGEGFYELKTEDTGDVRVRLFFTPQLLDAAEEILYRQIVNATRFPTRTTATASPSAASSSPTRKTAPSPWGLWATTWVAG